MHQHDIGRADDARDRSDVADEVEVEVFVKRRIDCICWGNQEQRIAVRSSTHDRVSADVAGGARPVLDDELLADPLGEPLTQEAHGGVGTAARLERYDQAHWPRRIDLRPRNS